MDIWSKIAINPQNVKFVLIATSGNYMKGQKLFDGCTKRVYLITVYCHDLYEYNSFGT
jgi:hypothetical protein